jgi:hypothetical protein
MGNRFNRGETEIFIPERMQVQAPSKQAERRVSERDTTPSVHENFNSIASKNYTDVINLDSLMNDREKILFSEMED